MEVKDTMANDFSRGKVWQNIVAQAIPLILAQLVQLLYNVVDRIYIGHFPEASSIALTGVGLAFPLTTLIAAFTYLFGTGGAAAATVISQVVSAVWVLRFLTGPKAILRIRRSCMRVDGKLVREIVSLGMAGFILIRMC